MPVDAPTTSVPASPAVPISLVRRVLRSRLLPLVVVALVVITVAVWQRDIMAAGVRALATADPGWLAVAVLAALAMWPTSVWMLRGVIPAQPPARQLFAVQLASPATKLIPGGPVVLQLRFLRRAGLSYGAAVGSMLLLGFATVAVRLPLLAVAVFATPNLMDRVGTRAPWDGAGGRISDIARSAGANPWRTAAIVTAVIVVAALTAFGMGVVTIRYVSARGGWRVFARRAATRMRLTRTDSDLDWKSVLSTAFRLRSAVVLWPAAIAQPLLLIVALWAVLQAVGQPLSLADTFVVHVVAIALAPLIPSPNGLATKEITLITGLTTIAGIASPAAVAAALGFRLLTFWGQIPLGVVAFGYLTRRRAI